MQPSHPTEYAAFSSNTGKEWSLYPTPSAAPRKANTSRNGNVPCCENYNRPQRLWLPAKLFRKLIKSCFTRCVRATARHPAAHVARPASECLPGSPQRKVCRGLPPRCTPLAACLPAARGLPPRCVRPAYPPHARGLASPAARTRPCLPAAHGARPATPPRAA